ncbi:MAG: nuclear transport factor 2 family protein [Thermodesulfobacteriota bacterium]
MKDKIYEINTRFYNALNNSDISLMEEIWLKKSSAKCVHPGWPILKGWDSIKESWQNIFETGGLNQVEISDIFVDIVGKTAWVNCIERINYLINNSFIVTMAQATNIFKLIEGDWKMVLHHASPMPPPRSEINDHSLQ